MEELKEAIKAYRPKKELESELMKNFMDSIKDKKVGELVEQIPLSHEILCHYTSSLEECAIDFDHCKHCKGLAACKNKVTG